MSDGVEIVHIVVVDDQCGQRDGRVLWLSQLPGVQVEGLSFEQAIARGPDWRAAHIAVLDGHDRRSPARRDAEARQAGIEPIAPHDKFVGVRVARLIRSYCTPAQTRIILISAYAREHDLLARRIAQAGVDYVFEHYEVERDSETFVRAVLEPETFSVRAEATNWAAHGYAGTPDVDRAVAIMEESPAGEMLLSGDPHRDNPELEWAIRKLRTDLRRALPMSTGEGSGPRRPRAPRKNWLATQFRHIFGNDLPTDPR